MNDDRSVHERRLVALLRLAYAGELAAAHAYHGHWRSVSDAAERGRIREIEEEELHHRRQVGAMLHEMGVAPGRFRDLRAAAIGRTLGFLCHLSGWLCPMYGAGKLESRNIREYEAAARHAWNYGRREWVDCLLTMAEVEWDHGGTSASASCPTGLAGACRSGPGPRLGSRSARRSNRRWG